MSAAPLLRRLIWDASSETHHLRRSSLPSIVNIGNVAQALELDGVAATVAHGHQHLLAHGAFLADVGLVDEIGAPRGELGGDLLEVLQGRDNAEVTQRRRIAGELATLVPDDILGGEMRHDVVAEEVEVGPAGKLASLRAAEQAAVEGAGALEVVDCEGKMEQRTDGHVDSPQRATLPCGQAYFPTSSSSASPTGGVRMQRLNVAHGARRERIVKKSMAHAPVPQFVRCIASAAAFVLLC